MITTKKLLKYYLDCDRQALGIKRHSPKFLGDEIWKFEIAMRKLDYFSNSNSCLINRIKLLYYRYYYHNLGIKLGYSIPHDVFGPGLAIVHIGTIVVSEYARIGANCRLHVGVNIGANAKEAKAARIGDNVYIGPGVKIIGNINIGDNVVIGANAVVIGNIEPNITVGGIPAKKISDKNSSIHINIATKLYNNDISKMGQNR